MKLANFPRLRALGMVWLLAIGVLATPGRAATVTSHSDPYMGCIGTLSGVIEPGDAESLRNWIKAELGNRGGIESAVFTANERLCLDSPGGSFSEAVRIVDEVFAVIGTAVPRGAQCLSACSIVFMAGAHSSEGDAGIVVNRKLHAAGRLGFHAPSLEVAAGNYSQSQVNKAYQVAVTGLAQVMARMSAMRFSQTLFAEMLNTPPSDFYYIDTVYKAARWQVPVVGTVRPSEITPLAASNACNAYYAWIQDRIATVGMGFDPEPTQRGGWDPEFQREGDGIGIKMEGFGQEGVLFCRLWVTPGVRASDEAKGAFGSFASVRIGDDDVGFEASPASFFDATTPLVALVRPSDIDLVFRDVADFNRIERSTERGQCSVYMGGAELDRDPCQLQVAIAVGDNLDRSRVETYVWPSGGKTVIEHLNQTTIRINGVAGSYVWDNPPAPGTCILNSASGNTFCFEYAG